MTDERIGKVCGACGWLVTVRDGEVALCMHDVGFLGPPPAIWVPLTEPMEARMLRFGPDGAVVDLGSVTVEPVDAEPIELAPYAGTDESWVPRTLTPEQERIAEAVGRAIAGTPDEPSVTRLSYFPEASYPGEVVVGHDGKPYGVLLPNGAIKPLPTEVP